ncbi:MAG: hypothetical protein Q4E34_00315 [Synergistaceae bacterium]|nr:hypothetical protein [Synergistaceae bacterium]
MGTKDVKFAEVQKREAIKRMRKLGIFKPAIELFDKEGKVMVSEYAGILWGLDEGSYPEIEKEVRKFEEEHDALVYMVIKTRFKFDESDTMIMYSFMYVSKHTEEWDMDLKDIFAPCAYVHNETCPFYSEFGHIEIRQVNGGLVRIA